MKNDTTKANRAKELQTKLDELANSIVTDPERLQDFARKWTGGFHAYSMGNTLLAMFQRPGYSLLAGFNTWKSKGRHVKQREKAVWILAPMTHRIGTVIDEETGEERAVYGSPHGFKAVPVFDVDQTDGEPVTLGCDDLIKPASVDFDQLAKLAPVPVTIGKTAVTNGYTDGQRIVVTERDNKTAMVATLFHEWGHVELKHSGMAADSETLARDIKELEAEAVSFLVCSWLGIDNKKSALYLGSYRADGEKLGRSGARIIKTAEKIIRTIAKAGGVK